MDKIKEILGNFILFNNANQETVSLNQPKRGFAMFESGLDIQLIFKTVKFKFPKTYRRLAHGCRALLLSIKSTLKALIGRRWLGIVK